MPAYSYVALSNNGSKKKGIISAESEREARRLVKDLKLTPLKVIESPVAILCDFNLMKED